MPGLKSAKLTRPSGNRAGRSLSCSQKRFMEAHSPNSTGGLFTF